MCEDTKLSWKIFSTPFRTTRPHAAMGERDAAAWRSWKQSTPPAGLGNVCAAQRLGNIARQRLTGWEGDRAVIVKIFEDKLSLSRAAAEQAAGALRRAIQEHGRARIIVATGASQLDF